MGAREPREEPAAPGEFFLGVRARPWKLLSAQRHPHRGGQQGYSRSSPTFRISHSILVSSMLLRPKGHSCLSSRLLFSSTICKQEGDGSRRAGLRRAGKQPPQLTKPGARGRAKLLSVYSQHIPWTLKPRPSLLPQPLRVLGEQALFVGCHRDLYGENCCC